MLFESPGKSLQMLKTEERVVGVLHTSHNSVELSDVDTIQPKKCLARNVSVIGTKAETKQDARDMIHISICIL